MLETNKISQEYFIKLIGKTNQNPPASDPALAELLVKINN